MSPTVLGCRLLLTFILFSCLVIRDDVKAVDERREMFGVKLRPSGVDLLGEVEKFYGKPVHEEERQLAGFHGQTRVDADGTPVLILNRSTGKKEESIVHELFHLRMIGEGSPTIAFSLPAATPETQQKRILWMEAARYVEQFNIGCSTH